LWLPCLGSLVNMLPKLFKLFGFPTFRLWWRLSQKRVVRTSFDIYVFITSRRSTIVVFKYCYKYCYSDSRKLWAVNARGRFGALKSDSTHHFFRNACTKSGSLRFSQFSGCWLILSVYILMSFDFPFVRLFGVR
jgi:hypothetical protein